MEIQKLKKKILWEEKKRRKSKSGPGWTRKLLIGLIGALLVTGVALVFYLRNLDRILETQFQRAETLLEEGEYSRAQAKFYRLYEKHPNFNRSAEALLMSGEILHLYLQREKEALLAYLLLERDYPDAVECQRAQYRIAEIYKYRLEDYDRALPAFQKLIDSDYAEADRVQYEIADTYFRQKNREQARIEFEYLVKNYPRSPLIPEALFRIGSTSALEGNFGEAEFVYRKVMEEYPDSPFAQEAQLGLVAVFERKGELRAALQLLETMRGTYDKQEILENKIKQIRNRMLKKKKAI
ncbi:MAG: tetratricopeptide repeat protein [Syntrophotaleaceae bacterium]